jgi:hypothetical protein
MRRVLDRVGGLFLAVGAALVLVVIVVASAAGRAAEEEDQTRIFWFWLIWGLILVLPYFAFGAILRALALLVPVDVGRPAGGRPHPLESPGVTIDEVLDGPGSAALKRRILQDLLTVGDITQAQYDAALADPRLTEAPAR